MQRPELFEQLDAFDPKWAERYDTTREAADAASIMDLFDEYIVNSSTARAARSVSANWLQISRDQVELRRQEIAEASAAGRGGRG